MSRSRKKNPIIGWCCYSGQKKYRSQENRAKRKKVKESILVQLYTRAKSLIKGIEIDLDKPLPHEKEYGNEWSSPRDGKQRVGDCWIEQGFKYNRWLKK